MKNTKTNNKSQVSKEYQELMLILEGGDKTKKITFDC